ncbi:MAG: FkbM family methyltransferase [Acidobacteriaceae bacterium]
MSTQSAQKLHQRLAWTARMRPMVAGAFFANLLAPERRTIIETINGFKFFADPLGNFGEELVKAGIYEVETGQIIRKNLSTGDSFLDVGANEGYFTTLAASIVGPSGRVIAVEPQEKLCDIIEVNLSLNGVKANVFHGALGGAKGQQCELFLYPLLNTGAASIVRKPKLYRKVERSAFVDPEDLLGNRQFFNLAKVDVEGFEGDVVRSLQSLLKAGKIKTLLVDYHARILAANKIDPQSIEKIICEAGMVLEGPAQQFEGYRLYRWHG